MKEEGVVPPLSIWDKAHFFVACLYVIFSTCVGIVAMYLLYVGCVFLASLMCYWPTIHDQLVLVNSTIDLTWLKYHLNVTANTIPDLCWLVKK
jgi:hypothetical protein